MSLLEIINRIEEVQNRYNDLWAKACAYDAIPDYELIIVFSESNPFMNEMEALAQEIKGLRFKIFEYSYPTASERISIND